MEATETLRQCWKSIERIYAAGKICSERHLQCEIFSLLSADKDFIDAHSIFVEPSIYSRDRSSSIDLVVGIIPDIVITKGDFIVCVLELKYKPNSYVPFEKDITNLGKFNELRGSNFQIFLQTNPVNGDWEYSKPFKVHSDLLLAYAVIANQDSFALTNSADIWKDLNLVSKPITNYIQLNGAIDNSAHAKFCVSDLREKAQCR